MIIVFYNYITTLSLQGLFFSVFSLLEVNVDSIVYPVTTLPLMCMSAQLTNIPQRVGDVKGAVCIELME